MCDLKSWIPQINYGEMHGYKNMFTKNNPTNQSLIMSSQI